MAALDPDPKVKTVDLVSGMNELKRRLEMPLGAKLYAAIMRAEKRKWKENRSRWPEKQEWLMRAASS